MRARIFALLALVFVVLTTVNAVNKGGDAAVFFEGGRRFLHAAPLYSGSSAADGFIGPPFQAMFFAPFAAVAGWSPVAARVIWHALNLACLAVAVMLTVRWWNAVRVWEGLEPRSWLALAAAPLAAVLLPLLTNFEHQNLNAVLLVLLTAATWQLTLGSALVAGALVGVATALKAFPALVILYLLVRRYWAAATVATVTAGALSVPVPLAVYGIDGFVDLATNVLASQHERLAGTRKQSIAHRSHRSFDVGRRQPRRSCRQRGASRDGGVRRDCARAVMRSGGSGAGATSHAHGSCR